MEQNSVKKVNEQLVIVPAQACHKFCFFFRDPRGFLGKQMTFYALFSDDVFSLQISVTFLSSDRNKRTTGNMYGCKQLPACQSKGALKNFHLSTSSLDLALRALTPFQLAAKVLNDLFHPPMRSWSKS